MILHMSPPLGRSSHRKLILFLFMVFISLQSTAQVKTVTGVVKDLSGSPLSGVSILVEKTSTGTTTDSSGHFTIRVAAGSVLIFSSANGATTRVTVGGKDQYNVTLEAKVSSLNDVVVVGYGRQKKVNL